MGPPCLSGEHTRKQFAHYNIWATIASIFVSLTLVLVCLVLVNVFTSILQALMKNIICGKDYGEIGKLAEVPDSAKYHIVGWPLNVREHSYYFVNSYHRSYFLFLLRTTNIYHPLSVCHSIHVIRLCSLNTMWNTNVYRGLVSCVPSIFFWIDGEQFSGKLLLSMYRIDQFFFFFWVHNISIHFLTLTINKDSGERERGLCFACAW